MHKISELIQESKLADLINHKYPDDEVKSAVWDYVAGYTTCVNRYLRNGRTNSVKIVTDYLDQAFQDKMKIDVYRTVDWNYFKERYGITKENIDSKIGSVILNKGYMSTSSEFKSPWAGHWGKNDLVMHIVSESDYPCIDINKMFPGDKEIDCSDQKEILLPRSTRLKLKGYEIKNEPPFQKEGTYIIEMEII